MDATFHPGQKVERISGQRFPSGEHYATVSNVIFIGGAEYVHLEETAMAFSARELKTADEGPVTPELDIEAILGDWFCPPDDIVEPETPSDRRKVGSDGSSTSYYKVPEHAAELRHLISHKGMSKSRGDIFKACYRLGEKEGVDALYDLNKMEFFIQDLKEMHQRGEHL